MSFPTAFERLRRWFSGPPGASASSPPATTAGKPAPHSSGLRLQRAGRREQLFALVRENMIRMGVLSSHYKFKVLTLDPAGEQFIVMVDWQPGASAGAPLFEQQFEASLHQLLTDRQQGFRVKAVYWRGHTVASGGINAAPARAPARAAPPQAVTGETNHHLAGDQAVSDDEIQALQAALRQAGASPAPAPARPSSPRTGSAQRSPEPLDFEPTVNTGGQEGTEFGALSETQYGKLS